MFGIHRNSSGTLVWEIYENLQSSFRGMHPCSRYPPSGDYRSRLILMFFLFFSSSSSSSSSSSRNLFIRRRERCLLRARGGSEGFRRGGVGVETQRPGSRHRKRVRVARGRVGGRGWGTNIGTSTAKSTRGFEQAGCLIRSQRRQPGACGGTRRGARGNRGIRGAQV